MPLRALILLSIVFYFGCSTPPPVVGTVETSVQAPFGEMIVQSPDFGACPKLSILDFGAMKGDKEKTSAAIANAIDAANAKGCGVVTVPPGEWLTKKIHFKSNVRLHLDEGAVLLFSGEPADYLPPVHTTWEGMECYNYSPLIYAYECENVAITGKGQLKAEMDVWKVWFARPKPHMNSLKRLYTLASENSPVAERQMVNDTANLRPHFLQFNRCKNVLLQDISIEESPFWVIHPYMSEHVTIRGVEVKAHGHNNDGVDPEMSSNMLIEDCVFDQGDDAIAVKAGRNQDAWRLNTPCKNIIIRNCLIKNGHQLLAIGSELSGGVENVLLENCTVESGSKLFNLVFIKTNERRGGYVKDIYVNNIKAGNTKHGVLGIETDVLYQWRNLVPTYEKRLTPISDIYLSNIDAGEVEYLSRIMAQPEEPVKNIILENISVQKIRGEEARTHENVEDYQEINVNLSEL